MSEQNIKIGTDGVEWITDNAGGTHSEGLGWNPQGVFCGECGTMNCNGCPNQFKRQLKQYICTYNEPQLQFYIVNVIAENEETARTMFYEYISEKSTRNYIDIGEVCIVALDDMERLE